MPTGFTGVINITGTTVELTVDSQLISIIWDDLGDSSNHSWVIGGLTLGQTTGPQSWTIRNDGGIAVELNIIGNDSAVWTNSAAQGLDAFVIQVNTDNDTGPGYELTDIVTLQLLRAALTNGDATHTFSMRFMTPTNISTVVSQSPSVTITATAP